MPHLGEHPPKDVGDKGKHQADEKEPELQCAAAGTEITPVDELVPVYDQVHKQRQTANYTKFKVRIAEKVLGPEISLCNCHNRGDSSRIRSESGEVQCREVVVERLGAAYLPRRSVLLEEELGGAELAVVLEAHGVSVRARVADHDVVPY